MCSAFAGSLVFPYCNGAAAQFQTGPFIIYNQHILIPSFPFFILYKFLFDFCHRYIRIWLDYTDALHVWTKHLSNNHTRISKLIYIIQLGPDISFLLSLNVKGTPLRLFLVSSLPYVAGKLCAGCIHSSALFSPLFSSISLLPSRLPLPRLRVYLINASYRCLNHATGAHYHSLDLACPAADKDAGLLGYVRWMAHTCLLIYLIYMLFCFSNFKNISLLML